VKVLVLTHRLPYAPNRGDRVRAYHIIRHLRHHARVHVVSLVHDAAEAAEADTLRRLGVEVSIARVSRIRNMVAGAGALRAGAPLTHVLLDSPEMRGAIRDACRDGAPDVVLAYCSGVARFALEPPLDTLPLVIDFVDVDSAKWSAFAASASGPMRWVYQREARRLGAFEARAAERAHAVTVVNARERETLVQLAPRAGVHVLPNGVDVEYLAPDGAPLLDPTVIFPAVFNYRPNAEGAVWLAREVWPLVKAVMPNARLILAGASPTRAVRALAVRDSSIEVTGAVPDMRPYLWRSAIAVAPLFLARGVQNKVLEAAAAGLPSVVTPAVHAGLPPEILPACVSAATPEEFARAIMDLLLLPPAGRRRLAASARLSALHWPQRLAPLVGLLEGAARLSHRVPVDVAAVPLAAPLTAKRALT
jgi:sugar transferase (PEP-CTERM/EpsH1 system associated)